MKSSLPIGPRAEYSAALLKTLTRAYDLGAVRSYADLGGTYNVNLRLDTARGTFVARVHRPWVTPERLRVLRLVKQRLQAAQIPVAVPIPARRGAAWVQHDDRLIEVEPFIAHSGATDTWQRYEQAFAMLGRMHTALAACTALPPPRVQNYGEPVVLRHWVARTRQCAEVEQSPAARAVCDKAAQLLQQIAAWWQHASADLPRQLTHGDYGGGNLLFQDEQIVAVLDFDFLDVHERVFDLAYTLYWMLERLESHAPFSQRSWQRVAAMLACYNATAQPPLTQAERRALPFEMARVPLYWIAEASFLPDPHAAVIQHARGVAAAHWLLDHADDFPA